jgi:hypothetical protein
MNQGDYEFKTLYEVLTHPKVLEQTTVLITEGNEFAPYSYRKDGSPSGYKPNPDKEWAKFIAIGTPDNLAITPYAMYKYKLPPSLFIEKLEGKCQLTQESLELINHLKAESR